MNEEILALLQGVQSGTVTIEEAMLQLKQKPFEDIGYAKVDMHRAIRQGSGEVIYGAGKTSEQIVGILKAMTENGQKNVLITRLEEAKAQLVAAGFPITYYPSAKIGIAGAMAPQSGVGKILVCTGGTSDIPVAEEAALTAEFLGNPVVRLYDVGVSGIHRLLSHAQELMEATVVIAIAGMEGALASVVGGLCDCPVIAVPTSVGYGAAFGGVAALLSMLNSCASGVSVVNIDNGFGAGYLAHSINHVGRK